jgi:polyribonucleotide nucleotidyltransferase
MNLVVAGTSDCIIMMEADMKEATEHDVVEAVKLAEQEIGPIIAFQEEIRAKIGQPKFDFDLQLEHPELEQMIKSLAMSEISHANQIPDKRERMGAFQKINERIAEEIGEDWDEKQRAVKRIVEDLSKADVRQRIVKEKKRVDNRTPEEIRPISCEVSLLPRTHGSALFTRGETQSLVATTLGTTTDEQRIDALEGESTKSFMLHYNFLPFSVGEVRMLRGPGRREIGHGSLSEKALEALVPSKDEFPYTIRVVSDILESNGSSSMATVCGASLSLMDAGIPMKAAVAGVSIGLITEDNTEVLLCDIMGLEDHFGDMDFKVAGTEKGITAIQLDTKVTGIPSSTLGRATEMARKARLSILDIMNRTLAKPREKISEYAPKVMTMRVPKDKIGEVIGPGGRVIRGIVEETGAKIDIDDLAEKVTICAPDYESLEKASKTIAGIIEDVEAGRIYTGKVKKILSFGAVVEVLPGKEGLLHISELAPHRVKEVTDVVKEGDEVTVKVKSVDDHGKISLSRKALLRKDKPQSHRRR